MLLVSMYTVYSSNCCARTVNDYCDTVVRIKKNNADTVSTLSMTMLGPHTKHPITKHPITKCPITKHPITKHPIQYQNVPYHKIKPMISLMSFGEVRPSYSFTMATWIR